METILVITGGILGFILALPFLALTLAKFKIFFAFCEEGQAIIILLNKEFHRAVIRYRGFYLNEKGEVKKDRRKEDLEGQLEKREKDSILLKIVRKIFGGGLVWVGIWPFYTVYTYKFRWQTLIRELDEKGVATKKIKSHKKELDYAFVKAATYFAKLEKAETEGLFPVSDEFIFTIRITNPYKALFRTHQWFEFTVDMLLPHLREYQGNAKFEDLIKQSQLKTGEMYMFLEVADLTDDQKQVIRSELRTEGKTEEEIEKELEERDLGVLGILRERYGIDVAGVRIEAFDPADERYQLALSKKFEAEQEVKRIDEVFGKIIDKYGEMGLAVRYLEVLEKAGEKAGNWIIPVGVRNIVEDIFGKKNKTGGD